MIPIKDDPRFAHIKIATRLQRVDDALVAADESINSLGPRQAKEAIEHARILVADLKTLVHASGSE